LTRGFDEYFGITASLDIPPYGFIHNDHFTAPLNTEKELAKGRRGAAQQDFEAVNVLPKITEKAVDYVRREAPKKKPFFLYFPLTSPHAPLAPTKDWQGKSGLGDYADFVMETDWAIGQVLRALDETGVTSNTLVIVTSDNGCSPFIGVEDLEKHGHFPSAQFRGYKSDIWDGGHREPFLVRWPGIVKPGARSDSMICLSDFIATCADILGVKLPGHAAEDSVSFLATLRDPATPVRQVIVHHSGEGYFAIRDGNWKLELCPGSGGWGKPSNTLAKKEHLPAVQLYDLSKDIGETNNVESAHADIVARLTKMLKEQIADGRSTPGPKETNDVNVVILKPIPEKELD
jgi:arylsulfatase A-like enzyme